MPKDNSPQTSIVIVFWKSPAHLFRCLANLTAQTCKNFEVILIDNGSTDDSLQGLGEQFPEIEIHMKQLETNRGFAAANNIGARLARGHWLGMLNADAFPEPDWLERLLEAADMHHDAFFASRQIQANAPDLLDGEGDVYHFSGLAWRRNYGYPVQDNLEIEEIFSPCAAAALYPRKAFLEAGGFDEDYFAYQEDVDLGFRLRLKGMRCYYVPQAVVHHVGSASTGKHSDFAIYYGHRNLVWTYVKNMPTPLFWAFLPLHLVAGLFIILKFLLTGHGNAILRAKLDAVRGLNLMLRKRKPIQQNRRISALTIFCVMERNLLAPFCVSILRRWHESKLK